ncbi:glycosyltransferase family 4 protein [Gramella sp. KN1008]|uniref:glycosyltransferase family 4 protein n=1 Tax=Gramella sp. KN1008 TaxID=2529298 RepID=UPI001039A686|nr:glycosyltransferase family 4 protein [Gramella sp. KN1008]TBW25594.1 glycosyltransferase family 1 protein [Gramella sp. KN1008]
MPKVLFLIDTLEVGGAETSILEIASRLKKWKPVVISIYKGDTLVDRFREKQIRVYTLNSEKKFNITSGLKDIGKIIEKERPDIIHATLFRAEQFSRILGPKYKVPVINSFVNDSYSQERYKNLDLQGVIKLKFYQLFDRITASRVDKFMSITKAIIPNNANALKINHKNIDVIYRGRDISSFRKKGSMQLEQLGNLNNGPVILTVSRLLKRKGYVESIKAMAKVINIRPDVKYLIAGEGHDRPVFEKLIACLELEKNVQLLGNRSDVPGLLQLADIFLFPSHYEGQGGALVEAMIMGTPIIAARIPVIEESVEDLKSALLFEPKDVEDLSNKILWALENSENMREIGKNAMSVAEERFDIEVVASEHEKLYSKVLKEHSPEV